MKGTGARACIDCSRRHTPPSPGHRVGLDLNKLTDQNSQTSLSTLKTPVRKWGKKQPDFWSHFTALLRLRNPVLQKAGHTLLFLAPFYNQRMKYVLSTPMKTQIHELHSLKTYVNCLISQYASSACSCSCYRDSTLLVW